MYILLQNITKLNMLFLEKKFNSIKFVYAHVHVLMTIISDTSN